MPKYILGVEYESTPITTAHIRVAGQTPELALQRAKKVGGVLLTKLPAANLFVPREDKRQEDLYVYKVRITIESCEAAAKAAIGELVLRGSV